MLDRLTPPILSEWSPASWEPPTLALPKDKRRDAIIDAEAPEPIRVLLAVWLRNIVGTRSSM